jgi:hypothetical protein
MLASLAANASRLGAPLAPAPAATAGYSVAATWQISSRRSGDSQLSRAAGLRREWEPSKSANARGLSAELALSWSVIS